MGRGGAGVQWAWVLDMLRAGGQNTGKD